jgi:uncharacterized protein involved in type VI secretion and phage assembly
VNGTPPLLGKFKAKVTDNRDLNQRGRIKAKVIALDLETGWALPCSPYAGDGVGLFLLPPVDAHVWIEFEGGDLEAPIWSGCFWEAGQAPVLPAFPEKKVLKTASATITLDDTPGAGGITIETQTGMKITLTTTGIEITNGQGASIKMTGPQVSINSGALEVM